MEQLTKAKIPQFQESSDDDEDDDKTSKEKTITPKISNLQKD